MCTATSSCTILSHAELVALSSALAAHPAWRGPVPFYGRLDARYGADGRATGRLICYAPDAPACAVPHEMAHVSSGHYDHGPEWAEEFWRLAGVLRAMTRNPDQGDPLT